MQHWPSTAAMNNAEWCAMNNAEWCDVVCRTHGSRTAFDDAAWTSRTRTPPLYPDAVTLVPDPSVPDLLARIDSSVGCSVKDSFASLDLTAQGFRVLFEAEWIVRTNAAPGSALANQPRWEQVADADALEAWEHAWRRDGDPRGLFRAELLDNDDVTVLAAPTMEGIVAGAVLYHGAEVVGLSNFFTEPHVASSSLASCLAFADTLFPGTALVGYESGDRLDAARACGFATAGPLRVWVHEG
jgi:hypothetical protein